MSNRVAYFAGNTLRRDHINWPTITREEIPDVIGALTETEIDRIWPVDVTLDQIMALAWRVKKWRLTGTIDVSKAIDHPTNHVIDYAATGTSDIAASQFVYPINNDGVSIVAATREADLLKTVFDTRYQALVSDGIGATSAAHPIADWAAVKTGFNPGSFSGSTPATGSVPPAMDLNIFAPPGFVLFDPLTELFSPPFLARLFMLPATGGNIFTAGPDFARTPRNISSGLTPNILYAPMNLEIITGITDSIIVPMELGYSFIGEPSQGSSPGANSTGTASGALTLEAVEYWPYKNTDGTPVYDTATGAELADPFS